MSIKKNLMAIAITALAGGSVFAQVSVNSQVGASVQSYSVATGNAYSSHAASALANNSASAAGTASSPGFFGPYYQASAAGGTVTNGSTTTSASGIGQGSANAGAAQAGTATSNQAANAIKPAGSLFGIQFGNGGTVGNVSISSLSTIGTQSNAGVSNSGLALSGSQANANNNTFASVSAPSSGTSNASGSLTGSATVTTYHVNTPGDSSGAGGTISMGPITNIGALQNGSFAGTITRP
ncbi:MAG: hypothetical protein ACWA6Y_10635 [Polaromonas sp.]